MYVCMYGCTWVRRCVCERIYVSTSVECPCLILILHPDRSAFRHVIKPWGYHVNDGYYGLGQVLLESDFQPGVSFSYHRKNTVANVQVVLNAKNRRDNSLL